MAVAFQRGFGDRIVAIFLTRNRCPGAEFTAVLGQKTAATDQKLHKRHVLSCGTL